MSSSKTTRPTPLDQRAIDCDRLHALADRNSMTLESASNVFMLQTGYSFSQERQIGVALSAELTYFITNKSNASYLQA